MLEIFVLWFVMLVITVITIPFADILFGHLPAGGYGFAKTLGLLLLGYFVWLLASLHLAPFAWGTICFALILLTFLGIALDRARGTNSFKKVLSPESLKHILLTEGVFVISLALFTIIRSGVPDIAATEKPMDMAFINAIID